MSAPAVQNSTASRSPARRIDAALVALIVGGFNQVRGALVGGLLIGVADSLAAAYISTQYRLAVPLVLLVAIILVKPEGLMGRKEERRV